MKLSAILTFVLSASASAAAFGWTSSNEQVPLVDDLKVPGANPLTYCEDPSKNLLVIDKVDLDPNPPKA